MAKTAKSAKAGQDQGSASGDAAGSAVHELPDGPPDAAGLTPRQRRVLAVIRDSVEAAATRRACARSASRSVSPARPSVAHQLRVLESKGYLRRDPNRPRAVEVLHA